MIQSVPDFQVDGRFDMETYRTLLAQAGYEPARFEAAQRVALRREQLQRAIRGSALVTPSEYRRFLNLAAEQRVVTIATIDEEAVADDIGVTDEMVTAYYDQNPALFQLPETADIEYVEISRSDVSQGISVSEQELNEFYEFNKDRYLQDEQRQARHILITFGDDEDAAKALATDLLGRVRAGESFEQLAEEYSEDSGTAANGGDLGVLTESALGGELGGAIFSMSEGDVEGPVKTDFGFHIVRLDRIFERGPLSLDQVRAELIAELQDQKADSLYLELERKLSDALFDATDIETLAAAVGTEVKSIEGFSRQGGEPLGANQAAIDAVFDESILGGGLLSEIVELDAGRAAVFVVNEHTPATRQPLADVREQVVEALRAEQAELLMGSKADDMLAALRDGTSFAAAAEANGFSASEPIVLTRNAEDADPQILSSAFTVPKPTEDRPSFGSSRRQDGSFAVFSVDAVLPGRPEAIPLAERDAGKLQLADQSGIGDFVAFVQALRADADVAVNEDVLAGEDLLR